VRSLSKGEGNRRLWFEPLGLKYKPKTLSSRRGRLQVLPNQYLSKGEVVKNPHPINGSSLSSFCAIPLLEERETTCCGLNRWV